MCQAAAASSGYPGKCPDEPCELSGDGGVHDVGRLEAAPQMDGAVMKPAALPAQAACARHLPMAGADIGLKGPCVVLCRFHRKGSHTDIARLGDLSARDALLA